MADATYARGEDDNRVVLAASANSGEVRQLADGRAGVMQGLTAGTSLETRTFKTNGIHVLTKATGIVLLDGGRAYWDHSANDVTFKKVNDRDFYLGRVVGDAASADTEVAVNLNLDPKYDIDLLEGEGGVLSVATGTSAAGGFGLPVKFGHSTGLSLTATSEAQSVDLLSVDRVALASNPIAEFVVRLGANGSTSAVDINFGLANGTSTTDADAITESVFFHIDGGALDLFAESDDGTTEVNATDTTVNVTAGTAVANRFEYWIDARDPASVRLYVDGVRVLSGTTFVLTAATGPLGLLAHVEKTTGTATAGPILFDRACLRISEQ